MKIFKFGISAIMALSILFSTPAMAIVGKFQFVNGEVLVIDATGKQRVAKKGDNLNEGEVVSTSQGGFAQIKMEDGGFFAVRPDSRFRVDNFKYEGKEDGSEKGFFSLIKGSLRSVTGIVGKKHKDNYKIRTATSTIGIRGSGADVGHEDAVGTAVRTLFGGHSLTTEVDGKLVTVDTRPGQIAFAAPGESPKLVPNFPFSTSNGPADPGQGVGDSGNAPSGSQSAGSQSGNNEPQDNKFANREVVIPVLTTDGINLTNNTDEEGLPLGESSLTLLEGEPAAIGTGVATVALLSGDPSPSLNPLNEFSTNDGTHFVSGNDAAGHTVAFTRVGDGAGGTALSFGLNGANLLDGGSALYGVTWGRWDGPYTADSVTGGTSYANVPVASLHYITSNQITPVANLTPAHVGVMSAVYNSVGMTGTTPTTELGGVVGSNVIASVSVNFSTQQISSYNLTVTGGGTVGNWTASGSGSIANFIGVTGIPLSGGCFGASSGTCMSTGGPISGKAVGAFVGSQAEGMISTFNLKTNNTERLIGTVYSLR